MKHGEIEVSRRLFLGGGLGVAVLALAGCGFENGGAGEAEGSGDGPSGTLRLASSPIDSLDPHYVNNAMLVVPAGLLEGLVFSNDKSTEAIPAAAESWQVSDDQTTYTFTMRSGATWSNGDPVTAADAEWSFRRLLTPTGAGTNYAAGASSYLSGLGIKGAMDHLSGATQNWDDVGVAATDDATLVIELETPNPDFLLFMSHYSMVLVHPPSVEANPDTWMQPENWVGNGAYLPESWEPTSSLKLRANKEYWDYRSLGVETVDIVLGMDATASLTSFRSGELDVVSVNPIVAKQDATLKDSLVELPGYTSVYLQRMWGGHPALADDRVRRALSMAIDRDALAKVSGGAEGGTTLMPGNIVPGWDSDLAMKRDVDAARKLMKQAGLDEVPDARLQYTFEDPWLEALADQWQDAFGLKLHIDYLESGVHADTRWAPYEDASVMSFYGGTFSGLPTMTNWLSNIFGPDYVRQFSLSTDDWLAYQQLQGGGMAGSELATALEDFLAAKADPRAQQFTELVRAAGGTLDEDERLDTQLQAAALREEMAYTIPLMWKGRLFAVSEGVGGFVPRPSPEICYFAPITRSGA